MLHITETSNGIFIDGFCYGSPDRKVDNHVYIYFPTHVLVGTFRGRIGNCYEDVYRVAFHSVGALKKIDAPNIGPDGRYFGKACEAKKNWTTLWKGRSPKRTFTKAHKELPTRNMLIDFLFDNEYPALANYFLSLQEN